MLPDRHANTGWCESAAIQARFAGSVVNPSLVDGLVRLAENRNRAILIPATAPIDHRVLCGNP